jgi:hypothetical protein
MDDTGINEDRRSDAAVKVDQKGDAVLMGRTRRRRRRRRRCCGIRSSSRSTTTTRHIVSFVAHATFTCCTC